MMDIQGSNLKVRHSVDNSIENPEENGHKSENQEMDDRVPGPAGGDLDLEGIAKSSHLYPLDRHLNRGGVKGHEDEDLGTNSDGTNPGTEYIPPLNEPWED